MDLEAKKFLYRYLNNPSPTGAEAGGQQIWLSYLKPFVDDYFSDTYGSAVGVINPEAAYKVVIEAHADEIAWMVNYVDDDGYIYVIRNGGSDHQIAPSMRVNIHTENGIRPGVFGWPAIHVRKASKEKPPSLDNIFIDVGASSRKEVEEMGIQVGTNVTFQDELTELNNTYLTGRALDNRIGGFMIAEVARKIHENNIKLPFGLYVVNAVQEEIGLKGAKMIAESLKPNLALVTDVCHHTKAPMYEPKKDGDVRCGKGPTLSFGPTIQGNLVKKIVAVAQEHKIAFQRNAVSRSTGTDTDAFAYANGGTASALISLPLKYMHTTVETAHKQDIQDVISLIYHFLCALSGNEDFRYIT